jgi:D-alanyl-D-alanine carboxypeptidase (penicillin-binding protein 5/6)
MIISSSTSIFAVDLEGLNDKIHGALLGDLETGEILYEHNIDQALPLASISKLIVYSILMDKITEGSIKYDDEITISENAVRTQGSKFGMKAGEKIKVSMMIDALLVISGNDVTTAIAEHIAGTEDEFVKMMYEKSKSLGLSSVHFINSHGYPSDDIETDQNYMSIKDLYTFVRYVLNTYPQILEITKKTELIIPERNFNKKSTNPLFGEMDGVDGLKTGYTDKAGICLVSTMSIKAKDQSNKDFRIIAIVMGAQTHPERIEKAKKLLEHGRDNYINQILSTKEDVYDKIHINNAKIQDINVYAKEGYNKLTVAGQTVRIEKTYIEKIKAPLANGAKVGEINYYLGDEKIKTIDIEIREDVQKANFFVMIGRFFQNLFKSWFK